ELRARLGRVADQTIDLRWAEQLRIDGDVLLPVESDFVERDLDELAHAVLAAGRDHVVGRLVALQHAPHRFDVVAGETPVALRVQARELALAREAELCARRVARAL